MGTRVVFSKILKKIGIVLISICFLTLMSCAQGLCPAYSKSGKTNQKGEFVAESIFNPRNTPSPFTEKYKKHLLAEHNKAVRAGTFVKLK
jgi:hypothetical protein